jgi:poly(U)-specific endoribonuclease
VCVCVALEDFLLSCRWGRSPLAHASSLSCQIWFELYGRSRGGRKDSSGFEHVFVGEIKDDQVSGFHNWIHMVMEEQAGRFDYRGYIKPRGQAADESGSDDHLLTIQFLWNGVEKFVGSSFIGTSPEFEMALYTMCFLVGDEENHVELNTGNDTFGVVIKCYRIAGDKIGTSFPEVSSHYDE